MNDLDHTAVMEIINSPEFQAEKDKLVKHYNINASAKYTLVPRDDFVTHIIKEFIALAIKD